ncbi:MAG: HlyD family efflux transporter periplasmic adaptor subunit [Dysgonamonadaceae bacterium]|jgi:HlyD family secretion protein|nr:HlyD family efflux transporter periplasmic adaptor subunit [Dysgonamonadaceae bacterium]
MREENEIELRSEEFQEVLGSVPSWILRWGIMLLAMVVGILLVGSAVIKYPDVISARIVLTGMNPPANVVARSSGKISELYVQDNQEVKAGDYLAVIDNSARTQDIAALQTYLSALDVTQNFLPELPDKDLQVGNLQTLYANFYITLFEYLEYKRLLYYPQKTAITRERIVQYKQQYRNLLRQQRITQEQFSLIQNQYRRDSLLHISGVISSEELEKSKNQYLQSILACENMQSSVNNMQIQIAQLKESLLDTGQQEVEKFNGLYTQLLSLVSQIKTEIEAWELSFVLKAPVAGKITFTNYWTVNQNVSAGSDIFSIIPAGDFLVIGKALLPVARSGKVKAEQKVNIRLENFPENEYGILRGTVRNISLVPAPSDESVYYTVEIVLPHPLMTTYRKVLPRLPNMQGQADIVTEDISLLERLILPIKKIWKESTY